MISADIDPGRGAESCLTSMDWKFAQWGQVSAPIHNNRFVHIHPGRRYTQVATMLNCETWSAKSCR
jgi:hypothetical protein